jgi:hypothetical protein
MSPRTKFVLIFLLFSVPFVASTVVYLFYKPTVTRNYGELISPAIPLPDAKLNVLDAGKVEAGLLEKSLRGKWLMLTRDSGACEAACRKKLYAMRQARLILGREQDRVVRVILVDDDIVPSPQLLQDFQGTVWVAAKSSPWLAALPVAKDADARSHIYGVDTLGNAFIRYGADPDIKRLMRDFQLVLKASQIG